MKCAMPIWLEIAREVDRETLGLGVRQRGQQHGRKNGDDRDDHEQFDQGERAAIACEWQFNR